jgi:hypothetical protein
LKLLTMWMRSVDRVILPSVASLKGPLKAPRKKSE